MQSNSDCNDVTAEDYVPWSQTGFVTREEAKKAAIDLLNTPAVTWAHVVALYDEKSKKNIAYYVLTNES